MNPALLHIDTGDTAWMLVCAALAFLVTPGLAFYCASFAREENTSSILTAFFATMALVTLQWILIGYSLAFGPDIHGSIGSLLWAGLGKVQLIPNPDYCASVPHLVLAVYQGMFALFASALVLSFQAERMKFSAFVIFTLLWTTLVFDPVAHWVWGIGGFLHLGGALDFGGGAVVHVNAATAALVTSLVLGQRRPYVETPARPALPLAAFGVVLVWFGGFGWLAGNAFGANSLAANVFGTLPAAAAASGFVWFLLERMLKGKPTLSGLLVGIIGGLVAITPAAGFVTVPAALAIGFGAAVFSYAAVSFGKRWLGYGATFDAFGTYLVSAVWGVVATGLWATRDANLLASNGLFYGNPAQLGIQIKLALSTAIYSFVMTYLILKGLDLIIGVRVREKEIPLPAEPPHEPTLEPIAEREDISVSDDAVALSDQLK